MSKTIYDLELHETLIIHGGPNEIESSSVTRVPGSWIYETSGTRGNANGLAFSVSSTFVPYNDEFKPKIGKASDDENLLGGFS